MYTYKQGKSNNTPQAQVQDKWEAESKVKTQTNWMNMKFRGQTPKIKHIQNKGIL